MGYLSAKVDHRTIIIAGFDVIRFCSEGTSEGETQRVLSSALFIFISGKLDGCAASVAQRDAKLFKGIFFRPSPASGSSHSRDTPPSPFSIYLFSFFFPSPLSFHNLLRDSNALIFHVSSLGPDFHGFLDIAGSTTFFSPFFFFSTPSSKMEGIKTRDTLMPSPRAGLHPLNNDFAKSRV